MDSLRHDLLTALRAFRHRPGFALTSVLIMALGIAAATTLLKDIRSSCAPGRLVVQDTLVLMDADGRPARRLQSLTDALETAGIERFDGSIARPDYTERYALSPVDHHPNAAGHGDLAQLVFDWVVAHVK